MLHVDSAWLALSENIRCPLRVNIYKTTLMCRGQVTVSYSYSPVVEHLAVTSLIWNTWAKHSCILKAQPCSGLSVPLAGSGPSQCPVVFALFSFVYTTHLGISHIHIYTADDTDLHMPQLHHSTRYLPYYDKNFVQVVISPVDRCQDVRDFSMSCLILSPGSHVITWLWISYSLTRMTITDEPESQWVQSQFLLCEF